MNTPDKSISSPDILKVRHQIDEWRQSPTRSRRMPQELWAAAIDLAKEHGVSLVSRSLKIGYTDLKHHVRGDKKPSSRAKRRQGSTDFVELRPQQLTLESNSSSSTLEVTSPDGGKMTVRFSAGSSFDLPALVSAFRGYQR